eukprot:m.371320 g.371320  ORF g.371320 m.371320 type:complete len:71 (+) comp20864_c0_seq48:820-1032(+)
MEIHTGMIRTWLQAQFILKVVTTVEYTECSVSVDLSVLVNNWYISAEKTSSVYPTHFCPPTFSTKSTFCV